MISNYKQNEPEIKLHRQCTYKCNIETHSYNHHCCGKALSIIVMSVFVALVIQHAKRMRCTVIPRLTSDPANEFFG